MIPPNPPTAAAKSPIESVFARVNYEQRVVNDGSEFKLDTIREILSRLDDPHLKLNVVHIAGTKGKGSTACFVARIGSELGFKTGIYSSPHFERYTERFVVDNQEVSVEVLDPVLTKVLAIVEEIDSEIESGESRLRPATFFDISTATAFLLFHELGVELVALEVGLGGRLDSTNVCRPIATIVTNISLDHTKQLGSTTTQIAAEKAAIIKTSVPAICGRVNDDVFRVIEKQASEHDSPLMRIDRDFGIDTNTLQIQKTGIVFDYEHFGTGERISDLQIPSIGEHQAHNACLAIETFRQIDLESIKPKSVNPKHPTASIDLESAVRNGLMKTVLKGRLEFANQDPLIITDMAHNEASIDAMIKSLKPLNIEGKAQAIFSCSKDKDYRPMLQSMLGFFDQIIFTEFEKNPRSQSAEFLISEAKAIMGTDVENLSAKLILELSPAKALQIATQSNEDDGIVVVCGSVFLVGELLPIIKCRS